MLSITSESARLGPAQQPARLQGASSKLQSALPSVDNKRRGVDEGKERMRKRDREEDADEEKRASAGTAKSSSLWPITRQACAGRCTYANGKVAIKILRKRYHAVVPPRRLFWRRGAVRRDLHRCNRLLLLVRPGEQPRDTDRESNERRWKRFRTRIPPVARSLSAADT